MKFVSKDGLFFRRYFSKGRTVCFPVATGGGERHQMKLNHRQRQAIHDTLAILGDIQTVEHHTPYKIEGLHQATATPIEATLGRDDWKQVPMFLPLTEHFGFHIPATALANQGHRQQFTVRTFGCWTGSLEERSNLEPNIINHNVHPGTKIVEVVYHWRVLRRVWVL